MLFRSLREALAQVRASWIGRWVSRHVSGVPDSGSHPPLAVKAADVAGMNNADGRASHEHRSQRLSGHAGAGGLPIGPR